MTEIIRIIPRRDPAIEWEGNGMAYIDPCSVCVCGDACENCPTDADDKAMDAWWSSCEGEAAQFGGYPACTAKGREWHDRMGGIA